MGECKSIARGMHSGALVVEGLFADIDKTILDYIITIKWWKHFYWTNLTLDVENY